MPSGPLLPSAGMCARAMVSSLGETERRGWGTGGGRARECDVGGNHGMGEGAQHGVVEVGGRGKRQCEVVECGLRRWEVCR